MVKSRSKNLLITGGAGFIGSNYINYILKKDKKINIVNLDKLTYASNIQNLDVIKNHERYNFIKGDICDKKLIKTIFSDYRIDGVINFAAESHVDNSIKDPRPFIKTNILGLHNLLECSYKSWMISPHKRKKEFKHARFHQISTDEVYGSIKTGSFDENSMYKPSSPYSSSKASADLIVNSYFITYGLNTTISISSNNYGKGQNDEKLIPTVINSIISKKTIPVYGHGLNVRDWIHVLDHCSAIDKIFEKSSAGQSYNVAGNEEMSNLQLIKIILDSYNQLTNNKYILKDIIEFVDDRFGHDFRYSIVTKKIKNDLLWGPKENFNFRIRELIQTYSNIK